MKSISNSDDLVSLLNISPARGMEAIIKAQLIVGVLRSLKHSGFTHAALAERSGIPRSAVTGILSGSLQKVSIDRVLRLVEAAGLVAEVKLRKAA